MASPAAGGLKLQKATVVLLSVIALILVAMALRATAFVTVPLALAFFLCALVRPIQRRLNEVLPPSLRWLSLVATMATMVVAVALFAALIWICVIVVAAKVPEYIQLIQFEWNSLGEWIQERQLPLQWDIMEVSSVREALASGVATALHSIWGMAALLAIVFFLSLLMLLEVDSWQAKIRAAMEHRYATEVLDTVIIVSEKVRQYLLLRIAINALSGLLAGLWLWLWHVDFALVWGVLIFLLNFVPYIGAILAVIPPALITLIQLGGWNMLFVTSGLVIKENLIGNLLEPRLTGRTLEVSPTMLLISIVLWGWIWGPIGAVLAVPMTVSIIVIFAHVPALRAAAMLLSESPIPRPDQAGARANRVRRERLAESEAPPDEEQQSEPPSRGARKDEPEPTSDRPVPRHADAGEPPRGAGGEPA